MTLFSRKVACTAVVSVAMMFIHGGSAPAATSPQTLTEVSPEFSGSLKQLDQGLQKYQESFRHHLSVSTLNCADMDSAPAPDDDAYVKNVKAAFDEAMADAKSAAESKGATGNVVELKALEIMAKHHAALLDSLKREAAKFVGRIRTGKIRIDEACIGTWSATDRMQFRMFLRPAARKSYAILMQKAELDQSYDENATASDSFLKIPSVKSECKWAIACYPLCAAQNWGACIACLYNASTSLASYFNNSFMPCWNLKNKPRWTPSWAWRVGCLGGFLWQVA